MHKQVQKKSDKFTIFLYSLVSLNKRDGRQYAVVQEVYTLLKNYKCEGFISKMCLKMY